MSTYKQKFNLKYKQPKDQSNSLEDISRLTGFKKSGLQTIFNKGVGAFRTRPDSVRKGITSEDQWAMARVYAAVNPSSKAYKIDKIHLEKK
jgi:hypothetical protein